MITTQKIKLDFNQLGTTPRIQAVQGDLYTRKVEISLYSHKVPWAVPEGTAVLIRYRKPDRTVGAYDTLPNGASAYQLQGNTVSITIAPDALMLPGEVSLIVSLISGEQVLSVFEILLEVQQNHGTGSPSEGAGSCISGVLPGPKAAQEGQILAVEKITPSGTVQNLKAIDLPYYNSVQSIAPDAELSTESETVYCVTMSDGAQHTFTVKNGRDGADGKIGADGKSAYAYAQDGGYGGTESEFAEKMAEETAPLMVEITPANEHAGTSSHTCAEIAAAYISGRKVEAVLPYGSMLLLLPLIAISETQAAFANSSGGLSGDQPTIVMAVVMDNYVFINQMDLYDAIPTALPNPYGLTLNGISYDGSEAQDYTNTINSMIDAKAPAIPTALPNPHKLVLTGAVFAEYDGSGEITVEIPASSDHETETVLSDNLLDKSLMSYGYLFYYGGSGYTMASDGTAYSYYGFIPLRGTGTYRTKFQAGQHSSTGARIALVNDDNQWVVNATGTVGEGEDNNWKDFEFTVTQEMIDAGATKIAFDVYSLFYDQTMIVKDREYPSEFIPYGYIEVATDSARKQNNVLCEKTAVFLGDSICAGTTVEGEYYNYGWAGLIGEDNHMNWTNYGKNGGTITHRGADGTCIANIADTAIAEHAAADYVIFEGGCNDADQMKESGLGEISSDYATFDTATFSGAMESLILKLVTAYPHGKIGYIIPQKMYTGYSDYTAENHIHRKYFERAIEICRKWGIPYLDLWEGCPLNPKLSTASIYYSDGIQHLSEAGYQRITPAIEAWMRTL